MPRGRPRKTTDDVLMKSAELIGWALGGIEREIWHHAGASRVADGAGEHAQGTAAARHVAGNRVRREAAAVRRPQATDASDVVARCPPEARKRISEMMKKRWAERRKKRK